MRPDAYLMFQRLLVPAFLFLSLSAVSARAQGTVVCVPGTGGVINCPCSNNGSPGAGCNNSLNTGGAALTATGVNSLSNDSVQLNCTGIGNAGTSCSGNNINIISALWEGATPVASGVVWGDGVMCTGAPFYFLTAQITQAGVFHFPIPGTTGLSQAAISAGDPLAAGQTRWYYVVYRDSCPSFCTPSLRQKSNSYRITWTP